MPRSLLINRLDGIYPINRFVCHFFPDSFLSLSLVFTVFVVAVYIVVIVVDICLLFTTYYKRLTASVQWKKRNTTLRSQQDTQYTNNGGCSRPTFSSFWECQCDSRYWCCSFLLLPLSLLQKFPICIQYNFQSDDMTINPRYVHSYEHPKSRGLSNLSVLLLLLLLMLAKKTARAQTKSHTFSYVNCKCLLNGSASITKWFGSPTLPKMMWAIFFHWKITHLWRKCAMEHWRSDGHRHCSVLSCR